MENIINALSDLLWGQLVYVLLAVGIFFHYPYRFHSIPSFRSHVHRTETQYRQ